MKDYTIIFFFFLKIEQQMINIILKCCEVMNNCNQIYDDEVQDHNTIGNPLIHL